MRQDRDLIARLAFLRRVVEKEIGHLKYSDGRVFARPFTPERAGRLAADPELAEQVEAFASRFCRLQDTVGDKLLPAWLNALGEQTGAAIDNYDKAERLGVLPSADRWLEIRQLRNRMIHEYIEDMAVLSDALNTGHAQVPFMVSVAESIISDLVRRGILSR